MRASSVSSRAAGSAQKPRFIGLLLAALLISVLETATSVLSRFLFLSTAPIPPSSYLFLVLAISGYASFLVNPVFLFVVFYRLGRKIDLAENYASVAINIFVGGLLGGTLSFFLLPALLGSSPGAAFPDILSVVTTVANFSLLLARSGLAILFPAFVAIAFANFRGGRLSASPQRQNGTSGSK